MGTIISPIKVIVRNTGVSVEAPGFDAKLNPMANPPGILAKLKSKKASINVLMTNNVFFIDIVGEIPVVLTTGGIALTYKL